MHAVDRIPEIVRQMYELVHQLETLFPGRHFTLDGHLVGSVGEVLAAHDYGLELLSSSTHRHDARASDGRLVQIKATQGERMALRDEPDFLIVLRIGADGRHKEFYNGPGRLVWPYVSPPQKNGQRSITLHKLARLQREVPYGDQIPRRAVGSDASMKKAE